MSKIKVNQIEAATGSTITVPSGQTLDISSATVSLPATALSTLNASNLTSGTVPNARLSGITRDKLDLISTASDASLVAKGTAGVTDGYIQLNCSENSHGIKIKSPVHASGANYTLVMPPSIGTANQVMKMNSGATALEFGTLTSDGTADWDTTVKTSGFTATANKGFFCNTTSAAFTVTLPASPSAGDEIIILDYAGTFDTNALTINPNGNKIEGGTSDLQLSGEREGVRLVYIDTTQGWLATSGINEGTDALSPVPYSIDFLVIAGGGAGGQHSGTNSAGGGGAGGYRNSYLTETSGGGGSSEASLSFSSGVVYTITVGAGGTTVSNDKGNNGSDSSISGTGITTITSTGGGGGAVQGTNGDGKAGGSGGGATYGTDNTANDGGAGTANQGFRGGNKLTNEFAVGCGGGGAGAQGVDGVQTSANEATNGGNGLASSITGSSVTRAGGGGSDCSGVSPANGGSGGGGNGGGANNGTVNTGSGGGGHRDGTAGAGGSGVVILRMATAKYSGTTTGSPTVSTDGTDTILTFNASGSYTG